MVEVKISIPCGETNKGEVHDTVVINGTDCQELVKNVLDWIASDIIENCVSDDADDYADSLSWAQVTVLKKGMA